MKLLQSGDDSLCASYPNILYDIHTFLVRLMCIERLTYLGVLELAGKLVCD